MSAFSKEQGKGERPDVVRGGGGWVNRTIVGIILATFLSDTSHEMATAVLPLFLTTVGLGPAALGMIEGLADLAMSLSKLGGGALGHVVRRKRPWASLGYLVTATGTGAMALVGSLGALVSLRTAAWIGRGFRSPLRDYMLADAVEPTHYGRAFGLERAGDMLGAVTGPLIAALLVWVGIEFRTAILWTLGPGLLAAGAMFFLTRDRTEPDVGGAGGSEGPARRRFPASFWLFLIGVFFFGLGDFSRTFLIWLAARGVGEGAGPAPGGMLSAAVLLYAMHNLVSAAAAYPAGRLGDRHSKMPVLVAGYALGVGVNLLLAFLGGSLIWLVAAIVLSGVYIAVEETLEKAVAADLLPRESRSLGFGILACVNAVGDMASSLYVGFLLQAGMHAAAFGIAAAVGAAGVAWMIWLVWRVRKGGGSYAGG